MAAPGTEEELKFYLRFANPLALNLTKPSDRAIASAWIQKLKDEEFGPIKARTNYLKLLLFVLQRNRLVGRFSENPTCIDKIEDFPEKIKLQDVARQILEAEALNRTKENNLNTPYLVEYSPDLTEYVVSQEIPNFGFHTYYAFSREPINAWNKLKKAILPKHKEMDARSASGINSTKSSPGIIKPVQRKRKISKSNYAMVLKKSLAELQENWSDRESPVFGDSIPMISLCNVSLPENRKPPSWGSNLVNLSNVSHKDQRISPKPSSFTGICGGILDEEMTPMFSDSPDALEKLTEKCPINRLQKITAYPLFNSEQKHQRHEEPPSEPLQLQQSSKVKESVTETPSKITCVKEKTSIDPISQVKTVSTIKTTTYTPKKYRRRTKNSQEQLAQSHNYCPSSDQKKFQEIADELNNNLLLNESNPKFPESFIDDIQLTDVDCASRINNYIGRNPIEKDSSRIPKFAPNIITKVKKETISQSGIPQKRIVTKESILKAGPSRMHRRSGIPRTKSKPCLKFGIPQNLQQHTLSTEYDESLQRCLGLTEEPAIFSDEANTDLNDSQEIHKKWNAIMNEIEKDDTITTNATRIKKRIFPYERRSDLAKVSKRLNYDENQSPQNLFIQESQTERRCAANVDRNLSNQKLKKSELGSFEDPSQKRMQSPSSPLHFNEKSDLSSERIKQRQLEFEKYQEYLRNRRADVPQTPPVFSRFKSIRDEAEGMIYDPAQFGIKNEQIWLDAKKALEYLETHKNPDEMFFEEEASPFLIDQQEDFEKQLVEAGEINKRIFDITVDIQKIKSELRKSAGLETPSKTVSPTKQYVNILSETPPDFYLLDKEEQQDYLRNIENIIELETCTNIEKESPPFNRDDNSPIQLPKMKNQLSISQQTGSSEPSFEVHQFPAITPLSSHHDLRKLRRNIYEKANKPQERQFLDIMTGTTRGKRLRIRRKTPGPSDRIMENEEYYSYNQEIPEWQSPQKLIRKRLTPPKRTGDVWDATYTIVRNENKENISDEQPPAELYSEINEEYIDNSPIKRTEKHIKTIKTPSSSSKIKSRNLRNISILDQGTSILDESPPALFDQNECEKNLQEHEKRANELFYQNTMQDTLDDQTINVYLSPPQYSPGTLDQTREEYYKSHRAPFLKSTSLSNSPLKTPESCKIQPMSKARRSTPEEVKRIRRDIQERHNSPYTFKNRWDIIPGRTFSGRPKRIIKHIKQFGAPDLETVAEYNNLYSGDALLERYAYLPHRLQEPYPDDLMGHEVPIITPPNQQRRFYIMDEDVPSELPSPLGRSSVPGWKTPPNLQYKRFKSPIRKYAPWQSTPYPITTAKAFTEGKQILRDSGRGNQFREEISISPIKGLLEESDINFPESPLPSEGEQSLSDFECEERVIRNLYREQKPKRKLENPRLKAILQREEVEERARQQYKSLLSPKIPPQRQRFSGVPSSPPSYPSHQKIISTESPPILDNLEEEEIVLPEMERHLRDFRNLSSQPVDVDLMFESPPQLSPNNFQASYLPFVRRRLFQTDYEEPSVCPLISSSDPGTPSPDIDTIKFKRDIMEKSRKPQRRDYVDLMLGSTWGKHKRLPRKSPGPIIRFPEWEEDQSLLQSIPGWQSPIQNITKSNIQQKRTEDFWDSTYNIHDINCDVSIFDEQPPAELYSEINEEYIDNSPVKRTEKHIKTTKTPLSSSPMQSKNLRNIMIEDQGKSILDESPPTLFDQGEYEKILQEHEEKRANELFYQKTMQDTLDDQTINTYLSPPQYSPGTLNQTREEYYKSHRTPFLKSTSLSNSPLKTPESCKIQPMSKARRSTPEEVKQIRRDIQERHNSPYIFRNQWDIIPGRTFSGRPKRIIKHIKQIGAPDLETVAEYNNLYSGDALLERYAYLPHRLQEPYPDDLMGHEVPIITPPNQQRRFYIMDEDVPSELPSPLGRSSVPGWKTPPNLQYKRFKSPIRKYAPWQSTPYPIKQVLRDSGRRNQFREEISISPIKGLLEESDINFPESPLPSEGEQSLSDFECEERVIRNLYREQKPKRKLESPRLKRFLQREEVEERARKQYESLLSPKIPPQRQKFPGGPLSPPSNPSHQKLIGAESPPVFADIEKECHFNNFNDFTATYDNTKFILESPPLLSSDEIHNRSSQYFENQRPSHLSVDSSSCSPEINTRQFKKEVFEKYFRPPKRDHIDLMLGGTRGKHKKIMRHTPATKTTIFERDKVETDAKEIPELQTPPQYRYQKLPQLKIPRLDMWNNQCEMIAVGESSDENLEKTSIKERDLRDFYRTPLGPEQNLIKESPPYFPQSPSLDSSPQFDRILQNVNYYSPILEMSSPEFITSPTNKQEEICFPEDGREENIFETSQPILVYSPSPPKILSELPHPYSKHDILLSSPPLRFPSAFPKDKFVENKNFQERNESSFRNSPRNTVKLSSAKERQTTSSSLPFEGKKSPGVLDTSPIAYNSDEECDNFSWM